MKTFILGLLAFGIAELKYWMHEKGYGSHKELMGKKSPREMI